MLPLIVSGLLSASVFALDTASVAAKRRYCEERLQYTNSIQRFIQSSANQLAQGNQGGLLGAGVCWWHSRFTRNAAYLAQFRPDLPHPSQREAEEIIMKIRRSEPVVIPGYRNLSNFSVYYQREIQERLDSWQRTDGIGRMQWMVGLAGSSEVAADVLQGMMDELYQRVVRGEVVYQKLQMPGVTAHAWLVTDMEIVPMGYKLTVVDSNDYAASKYTYRRGMTQFSYRSDFMYIGSESNFVPYTEQTREEERLKEKLLQECRGLMIAPTLRYPAEMERPVSPSLIDILG